MVEAGKRQSSPMMINDCGLCNISVSHCSAVCEYFSGRSQLLEGFRWILAFLTLRGALRGTYVTPGGWVGGINEKGII